MGSGEGKKNIVIWGAVGLAAVAIVVALAWPGIRGAKFKEIFGRNVQKARLVGSMRVNLYAVAEAEKAAVLAETDEASTEYAKRSRLAVEQVAAALAECKALAVEPSPDAEQLKAFEQAFTEFRKVNEEVLALAVQNTNLKAQALSFDQSFAALDRMEQALSPYLEGQRGNPKTGRVAARALAEALRVQALQAPHIMEKTEARMTEIEARMAAADRLVRASLSFLINRLGEKGAPEQALAAYNDFQKITGEVVRLSRENTNVRSLVLTLDRKTKALAMCDEALRAMEAKVHEDMAKGTK
ncbi:MAG: MCP four helix bundle domain-containing protein [Humidesulfovibrio sp.]|uniref:MCP four helix bundle domain-containing protein n=1 Tax=Humidesulfovibrio sp. TaxID=2910988 RepID=UPI0027FF5C56|nr:MCP four helix bundle domain-containing protein [Humidesulfovibrio sp.]MDQ7834375.1 MCP four helix bundle domain-containing protein [Humidesulfovibrio sp.]